MAEFAVQHLRNILWRKQQRRAAEAAVNPILRIDPALAAELDLEAIANASPADPATSTIQAQTREPEIGLEGEPVRETTPQDAEPGEVDLSPTFLLRAMAPDKLTGFVQVPWSLIDSGVIGALERTGRCLGWLLVVLMRLAERRDRVAKASWRTLCRESGISKRDTLARHLRRLTKPWDTRVDGTPVTIPALLRQRSGAVGTGRWPTVWEFRPDGLDALGQLAADLLAAQAARKAQLQADRAAAGKKGMMTRWPQAANKQIPIGAFATKRLTTLTADSKRAGRGNLT